MFDIYSLAKPRVFKTGHEGGGSDTPSETPAPDSVEYESARLSEYIRVISIAGRVGVATDSSRPKSINIINAASDFGGRTVAILNYPMSDPDDKIYRTEFRPKQGLHNLDFTTPSETPSDNPGGDVQTQ